MSPSAPHQSATAAPLSPVLIGGMLARPLPGFVLNPLLRLALDTVVARHPAMFDRLEGLDCPLMLIDPSDLPFRLALCPDAARPSLRLARPGDDEVATASVRGPLLTLIDLMEGRLDGDAVFFSRALVIDGDTEAVVALRNALDGEEIDLLDDILSLFGPFNPLARLLAARAEALLGRAAADLAALRGALLADVEKQNRGQAAELSRLGQRLEHLERKGPQRKRPAP
ncbi:MAG TPA: SCP2 sterol-binding domain-containing protein [Alphaproteobacteria bacterium]|jgi:predicted lipid carrier protein YhbT|nr:SCP2 sterol-binding domain-containing protein [Alphaproteobacteria bacterium]MDP7429525.1 SCP2 sterol-binding domain-containing protein [Alphaproteobacteria bacterium]HJM49305.1 SCP2 sterol-binding domain-containing protein [Alphaproteobacteria bacterium]